MNTPDQPMAQGAASKKAKPHGPPPFLPTQEIRFAVVMYGGVSLAVYINGVAQELLNLVRATAPSAALADEPDTARFSEPELAQLGSARIYRKLGQLLGRDGVTPPLATVRPEDPIRTRFVVDILSGSSAGGINAVYLAKALANDQDITQLKTLWIGEADLARLLNDRQAAHDVPGMGPEDPPPSLLNNRLMFAKLLHALDEMDGRRRGHRDAQSPYVEELDLFVTATDIHGLTLPIRLADGLVYERRHRNVFHFIYATDYATGGDRNDFVAENNPFLAYAARCTSAFPFAFEPMQLADMDRVLALLPHYRDEPDCRASSERWHIFYKNYLQPGTPQKVSGGVPFTRRSFGDGGYLDNKPFSYATETLFKRRADVPVERKLLYVEPSPEHPEYETVSAERPNALENVLAALLTLPRYEPIREDLERVLERNRLIERVNRVVAHVEEDAKAGYGHRRPESQLGDAWASQGLAAMIATRGVAYGGYHRLKVAAVTDDLSRVITRVAGFDEDADDLLAIRSLMGVWQSRRYVEDRLEPGDHRSTQNEFLLNFDFGYRLRRLHFVQRKIDDLYALDDRAARVLDAAAVQFRPRNAQEGAAFRTALLAIKRGLAASLRDLRRAGREVRARTAHGPGIGTSDFVSAVRAARIERDELERLLSQESEAERLRVAEELYDQRAQALEGVTQQVATRFEPTFRKAAADSRALLDPDEADDEPARVARACLRQYYRFFEDYDMVMFPIAYETGIGETNQVAIVRISPADPQRTLAGTALFHFGAFLDRGWRQNDLFWGRMDAAERIIATLMPGEQHAADRSALIAEAQCAIIEEEIRPADRERLCRLLLDAVWHEKALASTADGVRALRADAPGDASADTLLANLRACLDAETLRRYFREGYRVRREVPPTRVLKMLSRGAQIVGRMLEGIARRERVFGRTAALWFTRFALVFWGLVEIAVPQSVGDLISRYWLHLLLVFEGFLVLVGWLVGANQVQLVGWVSLLGTLGIDVVVLVLRDSLARRRAVALPEGSRSPPRNQRP